MARQKAHKPEALNPQSEGMMFKVEGLGFVCVCVCSDLTVCRDVEWVWSHSAVVPFGRLGLRGA